MAGRKTHGMSGTGTYRSWAAMKRRTKSNPTSEHFADYAGRGITVCERWKEFEEFYADMGTRPSKRHSLGRVDNNKGYEPGNCKWQTRRKQQTDRRGNRKYDATELIKTLTGRELTLRQVSHEALASIRSQPLQGRDARKPEDIIAAFMLWLGKQNSGTLALALTGTKPIKAVAPKQRSAPRKDQHRFSPMTDSSGDEDVAITI